MSFDLYLFDMAVPGNAEQVGDLLLDDSSDEPLSPALSEAVAELERRFPSDDDDPDASPWASWPLTQPTLNGRCCAFNLVWSRAEQMTFEVLTVATRHGLTYYDPQGEVVIRPEGVDPPKRWWQRR